MTYALEVEHLNKTFGRRASWLSPAEHQVTAVKDLSLQLAKGETLAVVGESGSGKSTLARMLVGLETPSSGVIRLMGEDMRQHKRNSKAFAQLIQYVFQDPQASLNPRHTIGDILDAPLKHLRNYTASERQRRKLELLDAVQMPADALHGYPHEFSGGQAQRLAIARALAAEAQILVLDEPVSALDVSVQAQVLLLLEELKQQFSLSYLFISHDLAVVEAIADRVAVIYRGDLVECAASEALFNAPQHAYTQSLLASAPRL